MEPRVDGEQFEASFVRINTADKAVVGAGCLISERHVLTCAHVVEQALGTSASTAEPPQGVIHLDFSFLDGPPARTASVEYWQPREGPDIDPSGDVAVLRLDTSPPEAAKPARLTLTDKLRGREIRAYGFPKGHDAGLSAYVIARDPLANDWLQVEDTKETGRRIEEGFSGSPVEDQQTGAILGMVVASTKNKMEKVGFVIPTRVLKRAWPNLSTRRPLLIMGNPPKMPSNFVPRPNDLEKLRQAVIGDGNTNAATVTDLSGMGGTGKSVLAYALCRDAAVQEFFPDGIVWTRIGREPGTLVNQIKQVGQALDDAPTYYETPETGAARLRVCLADKAILLVLDDVWDAHHVEPFILDASDAPHYRTLYTTRDAGIAQKLEVQNVPLGVLEADRAVVLLRKWAKREDPNLREIAARLGYLPLALKIAGARLSRGMSGAEWLETFQRVSQIKLSFESNDPQDNLEVSFDLSVEKLPENVRQLYFALGIFPEDIRIPQSIVALLWRQLSPGLSQFECYEVMNYLAQLALLEENAGNKTVSLHDLLRDYIREQAGSQLVPTHIALLKAYNPDEKPWHQVEDDGYLFNHLAYHLQASGNADDLYMLLTASPNWMYAKFSALRSDASYGADLGLAISNFVDPLTAPELLTLLKLHAAQQVVSTRVAGYGATTLYTLAWLGRQDEALAHARLRNNTEGKYRGLLAIYRALEERDQPSASIFYEMQEAVRVIQDNRQRSDALSTVASALAQAGDQHRANAVLDEAQEAAQAIEVGLTRAFGLSTIASALAQAGRSDEAQEAARAIEDEWQRAQALSTVASALAQAGRSDEAQEAAQAIEDEWERTRALNNIADALGRVGRFNDALSLLSLRDLEEFPETLARWPKSFEQVKPGLSIAALREALSVIGWVRSDWLRINQLLSSTDNGK